ncbi:MAG: helix-turn-helix transcriptional regulator [Lachnospiraceae bacterium]|nr:helix-turn-helix transcriptional regulator [Lachnospiraceae bacterium]
MTFSDKVKLARTELGINQEQLAELMGVSRRSVTSWETTGTKPRGSRLRKLAELLQVSEDYLAHDKITDPKYGMEKKEYVEETRSRFGDRAAKEMDVLLEKNVALFAGGELSQEAKDSYFEAVMRAYITCKEEAKKTYGRKKS